MAALPSASPASKTRPSAGRTPNIDRNDSSTRAPTTRSGSSPPVICRSRVSKKLTASSVRVSARSSSSSGTVGLEGPRPVRRPSKTTMRRSASGNGNGLSQTASSTENIAALAPIPSERVSRARAVSPRCRLKTLAPNFRSPKISSAHIMTRASKTDRLTGTRHSYSRPLISRPRVFTRGGAVKAGAERDPTRLRAIAKQCERATSE